MDAENGKLIFITNLKIGVVLGKNHRTKRSARKNLACMNTILVELTISIYNLNHWTLYFGMISYEMR